MRIFLVIVAVCGFIFSESFAQGILNLPISKGAESITFSGAYLGFQSAHPAAYPAWKTWDRVVYVSSGIRWRHFIGLGAEAGFPVYRANNVPRNSYILLRVDLRLL